MNDLPMCPLCGTKDTQMSDVTVTWCPNCGLCFGYDHYNGSIYAKRQKSCLPLLRALVLDGRKWRRLQRKARDWPKKIMRKLGFLGKRT